MRHYELGQDAAPSSMPEDCQIYVQELQATVVERDTERKTHTAVAAVVGLTIGVFLGTQLEQWRRRR